jgi:putative FmdB family regulatory protein
MPTYVFKCPKCGQQLEQLLSMGEYAMSGAPMCCQEGCDGQQKMVTQLQPSGLIFKGTGWTPKFADGNARGPSTDVLTPNKKMTARRGK